MPPLTPSQTVGPFFDLLGPARARLRLRADGVPGVPIEVQGCVRDGEGRAVPDALLEIWQADAAGRLNHPEDPRCAGPDPSSPRPNLRMGGPTSEDPRSAGPDPSFAGFGRVHTDADGCFAIETIKPGRVPGPGRLQAPHLLVGLFARGLLARIVTRIYFDDEASNAGDPILERVPPDRRPTLVAASRGGGLYRFDIALQGPHETVFFDV